MFAKFAQNLRPPVLRYLLFLSDGLSKRMLTSVGGSSDNGREAALKGWHTVISRTQQEERENIWLYSRCPAGVSTPVALRQCMVAFTCLAFCGNF